MTTPPNLKYPVPGYDYILDTYASDKAVGAVLSQVQEGQEVVIAFYSKAMTRHKQAYCATWKDLLAVISSIKNFYHYLYGQDILLRTDNSAVSWIKSMKNPTGQVARWLQELETYNLTVTHRPGRKHTNADALSRHPCNVCRRQQEDNLEENPEEINVDNHPDSGSIDAVGSHHVNAITRS